MHKSFLSFVALTTFAAAAFAADIDRVQSETEADLRTSLAELASLRQEIESARIPLARQLGRLETQLTERKNEYAKLQRFQENQLVELNALKAEAKRQSDETKYIDSLVNEYHRAFRTRLHFAEEPRFKELFDRFEKASAAPDIAPVDRFKQRLELIQGSLQRASRALGGELIEGRATDPKGRILDGKIALLGPVAMFAGPGTESIGVLQQELNRSEPIVLSVPPTEAEAVRALATTGTGRISLDATLGNASKLAALEETLYEKLAKGGLIMIPLLGLGVAAVLVALVKAFQLGRIRLATESDLQTVLSHLEQNQPERALQYARSIPGVAGNLLATGVEHIDEKKEYIEEILSEKMLGARIQLDRGIAFLALSATTGPLMGLLGTVMGMISTFRLISSFGSGDPKALAAGISEALICTATGMAVAIPSLLFHAFLSRKAKGIIGSLEQTSVGFINGLPGPSSSAFA